MNSIGKTHPGMIRKNNQDNFLNYRRDDFAVLCVADGLGGHNAGEVASKICVEMILEYVKHHEKKDIFSKEKTISLINSINQRIYTMQLNDMELSGMGTTLSLCTVDEDHALLYQLGDSRVYRIEENRIQQLTKDHSLVQYMLDSGQITKDQAVNHPKKNVITRALGTDETVETDIYEIKTTKDEKLLLCSDGLYNTVSKEEICSTVLSNNQEEAAEKLIGLANAYGGSDNITVVLYEG